MIDSKVYNALTHLSVYELNSFKKFLASPYFNLNEDVIVLYDLYRDDIKNEKEELITKDVIWAVVYPDKKYNDAKYRKLNAELLKLFESYIAQKEYDSDKFLKSNMMLKAVRKKKIIKLFNTTVSSSYRSIENSYNKSSGYLFSKYYNEKQKLELNAENEIIRKRSKNIENAVNIDVISEYLDKFYISEKLKYLVKLQGWKKNYNLKQEIHHQDKIQEMIESGMYDDIPPIMIYYTILKTQLEPDNVDNYFLLKQQVQDYIEYFPDDEIRNIYDALLSFSVRRVNRGDLTFQEETLNVYKGALKKEVLFINGHISATTFNNIVFFALRTGQYDWAEVFINEYGPYLNEQDRINSESLSRARVEFYRKDYGKVIELLQQVEMESVVYNLSAKTLLLSSYYELDEFDALDSFLNSFRVYVNREKSISARKKMLYKNLLSIVKKIINISPSDKKGMEKLITDIEESPGVIIKPWLLQKMKEKMNPHSK